jgi:hypothetical protein
MLEQDIFNFQGRDLVPAAFDNVNGAAQDPVPPAIVPDPNIASLEPNTVIF